MENLSVCLGENSATVEVPGGKKFKVHPLNMNEIGEAEDKFGCLMDDWNDQTNSPLRKVRNIIFLIWLSMKRSNPDLKLEDVGEMFDLSNIQEMKSVVSIILKSTGLQPKNEGGTPA